MRSCHVLLFPPKQIVQKNEEQKPPTIPGHLRGDLLDAAGHHVAGQGEEPRSKNRLKIEIFLTGEAYSTCTAVRLWCVVCGLSVCHYKKCNRNMIDEVVIEVDGLDKGSISAEAGKQGK